jgi:hypothetical protein
MEQKQLPIKTKIAAWWVIICGIVTIGCIYIFGVVAGAYRGVAHVGTAMYIFMSFVFIFFVWPAFFLLQRKKWAWKYFIIILSIGMIYFLYWTARFIPSILLESSFDKSDFYMALFTIFPFVLLLFPFILLLFDRKNFFKSTS